MKDTSNNKKYLVFNGSVKSRDGDIHWITAKRVARLYRVNPEECIFVDIHRPETFLQYRYFDIMKGLNVLRPRDDGNYNL